MTSPSPTGTESLIETLTRRFLGWRLPENFRPDAGITFKAEYNENTPWPAKHQPTGTNLFDADQARAMFTYLLDGVSPTPPAAAQGLSWEAVMAAFIHFRIDDDSEEWEGPQPRITGKEKCADAILPLQSRAPATVMEQQIELAIAKAWSNIGNNERTIEKTIERRGVQAARFISSGEAIAIARALLAAFRIEGK